MAALSTVANCAAQLYCTAPGQALQYGGQYVVQWNNQFAPLNVNSIVTVQVYSQYDLDRPLYSTAVANINGMATLTPNPSWFSRYTSSNASGGENQTVYVAVFLQGNDTPSVGGMLPLQLMATPEQYAQIQGILHPSPTPSSSSLLPSPTETRATVTVTTHQPSATSQIHGGIESSSSGSADTHGGSGHGRLSTGAIVGIAVGSAAGLLLLLLLLLLPMYRRRQRRKRVLAKAASMGSGVGGSGLEPGSGSGLHPGGGSDASPAAVAAAVLATGGVARALGEKERPSSASPSDTPLLLGGRPNNSFTSRDDSLIDSQVSPRTAVYQPLSLESPRVMVNMPASTRTGREQQAGAAVAGVVAAPDPILTTDDARQIGDIFRNALRQPPPVSEDGASDGRRESMLMHMDDELEEDEDPGWRERVASERMHRELEQEASIIRSVAMRAHGSDYSSSRPGTSQSDSSHAQSQNNTNNHAPS
ncbi:hypothetical protein H4R19_003971 [Coemansia spiralis]|nr:hypothetical protein H4R19_003971 [Coemansia spiralis]